jgi:general secretion pathway protein D
LPACGAAEVDLTPDSAVPIAVAEPPPRPRAGPPSAAGPVVLAQGSPDRRAVVAPEIVKGTGTFVNPGAATASRAEAVVTGSDVTLNFSAVDVRDVLKSVLGDLLHVSYAVDPAVQGP